MLHAKTAVADGRWARVGSSTKDTVSVTAAWAVGRGGSARSTSGASMAVPLAE